MGYSTKNIRNAREYIKKRVVTDIFAKKGGVNFVSLSGNDIEYLFRLYDEVFFQNQIIQKLKETPKSELRFFASERTSGTGGVCTVEKECTYHLDIAPNILNTIFKRGLTGALGIGCADRVECLMLIMEHQIIHLLLILWGYFPASEEEDNLYGEHGTLFECMAKEYFGYESADHDLGISTINILGEKESKNVSKKITPFGYAYWSNSCYLDSLMVVLLKNISSFWRMGLMNSDPKEFVYPVGGRVCDVGDGSKIVTNADVRDHARKLQHQIKEDFRLLESPSVQPPRCSNLRILLAECLPGMRKGGWVTFSSNLVYDTLVGIFPVMFMDVPIQIHRWSHSKNKRIPDPVKYQRVASFNMWEYMEPLDYVDEGDDYKELRWDLLQAQCIVFYNGGSPRIKKFNETGPEKGFNIIGGNRYPFNVNKVRNFGSLIINGRYRLVGVVTLQGVAATGEGGTHYVARLLGRDDKWYYYNDMSPRLVPISGLPITGVWKEERGEMPSMYFYQKIRDTTTMIS